MFSFKRREAFSASSRCVKADRASAGHSVARMRQRIDRIERGRDDFAPQIERGLNHAQAAGKWIEDHIAGLRVLLDGGARHGGRHGIEGCGQDAQARSAIGRDEVLHAESIT